MRVFSSQSVRSPDRQLPGSDAREFGCIIIGDKGLKFLNIRKLGTIDPRVRSLASIATFQGHSD